jgi:arsenate reductase
MKRILFICADNSVLSQMAEAFLKRITFNRVDVFSAGITPKPLNQTGIKIMKELGIDISRQRSKSVNEFFHDRFDFVITVNDIAREKTPSFQGSHTKIHKSIDDPAKVKGPEEVKMEAFRAVRDQIKDWLTDFAERYQLG